MSEVIFGKIIFLYGIICLKAGGLVSSKKTEEKAISVVRSLIDNSELMTADEIKEGDKGVSLDGCIPLYTKDDLLKKNFHNKIDIQVKGRTVKQISTANNVKFAMDYYDVINYRKIGGVILFYVQISSDKQSARLYIKSLLPYEINQVLASCKDDSKKVSFNFEFIDICDNKKFELICFQFQRDKDKQYSYKEQYNTLEDFQNKKGNFEIEIGSISGISENPFEYLKRSNYVYFQPDDYRETKIPCGIVTLNCYGFKGKKDVYIGQNVYHTIVEVKKRTDSMTVNVNDCIQYDTKTNMFALSIEGNLSLISQKINMINDLKRYKTLKCGSINLEISDDNNYSVFNNQVEIIDKLKGVFSILNVCDDVYVDFKDLESIKNIGLIYNNLVEKKGIPFKTDHSCFLLKLKVFALSVSFLVRENTEGLYDLLDLFDILVSPDEQFSYLDESNERVILYPNFVVIQERFGHDSIHMLSTNIINKLELLLVDIDKIIKNDVLVDHLIWFILDLLQIYDRQHNEKLLCFLERISGDLISCGSDICKINYYQVLKRQNELSVDVVDELIAMRDGTDDIMVKASVSILLGSSKDCDVYVKKMNTEQKDIFKKYPIYNLYNTD